MKKIRVDKQKCKKQSRLLYGLCAVGMIVLIVAALFLPQMIFAIQDRYQMTNTEVQARNSLDILQLNMAYEKDLNARLKHYFTMKSKIATAIDYEFTEDSEVEEILATIFENDWFLPLFYDYDFANYVYTMDYKEALALSVADCKKYLIHGADYQDGVMLMMWYLDLNLEPINTRIRLLVDTESYTIYYMKITAVEEAVTENKVISDAVKDFKYQKMYYMLDAIQVNHEFYYKYYETDSETMLHEYEADGETPWYIEPEISENECTMTFYLPYGELSAKFVFQAEYRDDNCTEINMGFPIIGEMISEMIQD